MGKALNRITTDSMRLRVFDISTMEFLTFDQNYDYHLWFNYSNGVLHYESIPDGEDEYPQNLDTGLLLVDRCTGIRDTNGILMFESDTVQYKDHIGVIKFGYYSTNDIGGKNAIYGFFIQWIDNDDVPTDLRRDFGFFAQTGDLKIIGNTHGITYSEDGFLG